MQKKKIYCTLTYCCLCTLTLRWWTERHHDEVTDWHNRSYCTAGLPLSKLEFQMIIISFLCKSYILNCKWVNIRGTFSIYFKVVTAETQNAILHFLLHVFFFLLILKIVCLKMCYKYRVLSKEFMHLWAKNAFCVKPMEKSIPSFTECVTLTNACLQKTLC